MPKFREVYNVELLDAHVTLGFADEGLRANFEDAWFMSSPVLENLTCGFGNGSFCGPLGKQGEIKLAHRRSHHFGADFPSNAQVKKILARVDGPNMLSLRVTEEWEMDDGGIEEFTDEYTYCGPFIVMWNRRFGEPEESG